MTARRVVGRSIVELEGSEVAALIAAHRGVLLDLGTGDGKHAATWARARPDHLVIGVDANVDALRKRSVQMSKPSTKGGLPNLIYLWAAVERLPASLVEVEELHVLMPWGSLLRGLLEPSQRLLNDLSQRCRAGATFTIVINRHAWHPVVPEVAGIAEPRIGDEEAELGAAFDAAGWTLDEVRELGPEDLVKLGTSWTSRLGSSRTALDAVALEGTINRSGTVGDLYRRPSADGPPDS